MSETVSFVQIVTAVTHQGTLLYGLRRAASYTNTTSVEKSGFLCR